MHDIDLPKMEQIRHTYCTEYKQYRLWFWVTSLHTYMIVWSSTWMSSIDMDQRGYYVIMFPECENVKYNDIFWRIAGQFPLIDTTKPEDLPTEIQPHMAYFMIHLMPVAEECNA